MYSVCVCYFVFFPIAQLFSGEQKKDTDRKHQHRMSSIIYGLLLNVIEFVCVFV